MSNHTNSNLLFHFTGATNDKKGHRDDDVAFNTLIKILDCGYFLLTPNKRELVCDKNTKFGPITVNMCCFTETPIGFIEHHIKKFGYFGIGISMNWALTSGAHNVIYSDNSNPNSYARSLGELYRHALMLDIKTSLEVEKMKSHWLIHLVSASEDFRFHDEREWRIVGNGDFLKPFEKAPFEPSDIETLVCPKIFIPKLMAFLESDPRYKGNSISIINTEMLIRS